MSSTILRTAFFVAALGLSAQPARAATVFVNHAATGAGTGQTWADAFTSLGAALQSADPGDQVWVARGTYRPAPPGGSRDATFALKSGVEVYGGFAGNETSPAQRNPVANPTILSGDLNGNDTPNFGNVAENSRHVLTAIGVDAGALLDGFTVRGGNADFPGEQLLGGGGLFILDGSPTVRTCVFTSNSSGENKPNIGGFGGGLYVKVQAQGVSVLVSDCRFEGNRGDSGGAMGIYNSNGENLPHEVAVEDCVFKSNAAPHQLGGAVWSATSPFNLTQHQEVSFTRCRFEGNAAQYAGAIVEQNTLHFALTDCEFIGNSIQVTGGAVWHLHTAQKDEFPARVRGCLFLNNPGGGLVLASTSAEVAQCTFLGNGSPASGAGGIVLGPYVFGCGRSLLVEGCLFSGNAAGTGGAIRSTCAQGVQIVNSTFAGNVGSFGAGGVFSVAPIAADNCIFWGNTGAGAQTQEAQLSTSGAPISVNHSAIMGLTGGLGGIGNIGADPMFVDPLGPDGVVGTADDNLRLVSPGSACIDAGNNLIVPASLTTDLDGNPRFVDDPGAPNTGIPGGAGGSAVVDMGAYEFQVAVCYPDCNADGTLNLADFACFQTKFALGDPYADCNADGALNLADFGCFQTRFALGCP